MAEKQDDLPQDAQPIAEAVPVETPPEPAVTLDAWARRNATRVIEGMPVSFAPLMAGFVYRMRQQRKLAARPSEYQRLWARFQKE